MVGSPRRPARGWSDSNGPTVGKERTHMRARIQPLRRPLVALVALAAAAALAAGCSSNQSGSGGSGSGGGGYGSSSPATTSGGQAGVAMVSTTSSKLGTILVDGSGKTLYLFEKD